MVQNQKSDKSSSDDALQKRVAWLLANVWFGNCSSMGRDIGFSHTAINRVVKQKHQPGTRLLAAIGSHPRINREWLLSGVGEPLLTAPVESARGDSVLPLAKRLLPGPVEEHRDCLTEAYLPTAWCDVSGTRYWYKVTDSDQLDKDINAGDSLLIETDRSWLRRPDLLNDVLCAVVPLQEAKTRLDRVERSEVRLHRLKFDDEAKVLAGPASGPANVESRKRTGSAQHHRRAILRDRESAEVPKETDPSANAPDEPPATARLDAIAETQYTTFRPEEVVGVALLQQRRWVWR